MATEEEIEVTGVNKLSPASRTSGKQRGTKGSKAQKDLIGDTLVGTAPILLLRDGVNH